MHVSALASPHYKTTQVFGYGRRNHNLSGFVSINSRSWPSCYSVSGGDLSSERRVNEVMLKQAALFDEKRKLQSCWDAEDESNVVLPPNLSSLNQAYDLCREEASREKDSTFYWGTMLMTPEQRRAFWALVVWCRRTDELVDGPNASPQVTPSDLDNWESRLEQVFEGRTVDALDVALSDTVSRFHLDIQLFKDMIEGMRMDLWKSRYANFDQLYQYSYHVAGTVGLMSVPVIGIAPESHATTESVLKSALAFATANQLTNILRDVGEDARRGRVYLPQDELAEAGLSDEDIFAGKITDKWRGFMHNQIQRVRLYFDEGEKGVPELNAASRWPVLATLVLYRQILDEIEANDYNNFTKRATVSTPRRILALPSVCVRSLLLTPSKSYTMS